MERSPPKQMEKSGKTLDAPYFIPKLKFKATVNLFSYGKQRILIPSENNHYITPYKENYFFLNIYFSFFHNISVFISP